MITLTNKECAFVSAAGNGDMGYEPCQNMSFSNGVQVFIGDIVGDNAYIILNLQDGSIVDPYYLPNYPV